MSVHPSRVFQNRLFSPIFVIEIYLYRHRISMNAHVVERAKTMLQGVYPGGGLTTN
jgi:hypothetical protein